MRSGSTSSDVRSRSGPGLPDPVRPVGLEALDHLRARAVLDALGELEGDLEAGYRLRGRLTGLWSLRVGVYRIIYELRGDKTVRVVAIRHRGRAYDAGPR